MLPISAWFYAFALISGHFLTGGNSQEEMDAFSQAVLIGNYGGMGPPNNQLMRKFGPINTQGAMAGRSIMTEVDNTTDPLTLIELREGHRYPYGVVMEAMETLVGQQSKIGKRAAGAGGGADKGIFGCMNKVAMCATLPVSNLDCYMECMMSATPVMMACRHVLPHQVTQMCESKGTLFDKMIERLEPNMADMKRLEHFMELFQVPPEHYKSYASKAVSSLTMQITSNLKKPHLGRYRQCVMPMQRSLGGKGFKMQNTMSNADCQKVSLMDSTVRFVDMMKKKPEFTDILLSGYYLSKSISQCVPGPEQHMFSAFHDVVNTATGCLCGLIPYAETGEKVVCEVQTDETEEKKVPTLPAELKGPDPFKGACGTIPEFPSFDMNMGFKFPKHDAMK